MSKKKSNPKILKPYNLKTLQPKNPKLVFFGTPEFASIILQKLISEKFCLQLVITSPDKPVGRKQLLTPSPVKVLAQKNSIEVETPLKVKNSEELLKKIKDLKPDLAVVAAYGKILSKELLDIPKYGSINVHGSILPKYRGASPIQSAILAGEKETGITIILMDEKMDEGDILSIQKIPIDEKETSPTLSKKMAEVGADLLVETIKRYKKWHPKKQDHSKATYTKIISKEDGKIDFSNPPKLENLDRMIRAFYPWPSVWTRFQISDNRFQILKFLPCDPNAQLPNNPFMIQPEGKKPMTIKDFLNGHPTAKSFLGKILAD